MAKWLTFGCVLSTLLTGCDGAPVPKLAESEREYCAVLDQYSHELSELAGIALKDSNNDLRRELSQNAERELLQKLNVTLRQFFATHTGMGGWAVKLDFVRTMNNGIVEAEFQTPCNQSTRLVTVVSRNNTNVISFLASMQEDSYAFLTGSFREIAYRNYDESWWSSYPAYISFALSSIYSVNESGDEGIEAITTYASDPASLAVAAADVAERDRDGREHAQEDLYKRFMRPSR